jgi:hypothetical protein
VFPKDEGRTYGHKVCVAVAIDTEEVVVVTVTEEVKMGVVVVKTVLVVTRVKLMTSVVGSGVTVAVALIVPRVLVAVDKTVWVVVIVVVVLTVLTGNVIVLFAAGGKTAAQASQTWPLVYP